MAIEVEVRCKDVRKHYQEVSQALGELKKQIKKDGMMNELRKREHYTPPSKARRIKHNESIKQRKRDERKQQWYNKKSEF